MKCIYKIFEAKSPQVSTFSRTDLPDGGKDMKATRRSHTTVVDGISFCRNSYGAQ